MRNINKEEILEAIGLFENCIYDNGAEEWEEDGWGIATFQEWEDAVYEELINWKWIGSCGGHSHENRFVGKDNIRNMIRPLLKERLNYLKSRGYDIKAIY